MMFSVFFKKNPRELKKWGTKEDVAGLKKLATAGDHLLFTEDSSEIISVEGCYKKAFDSQALVYQITQD